MGRGMIACSTCGCSQDKEMADGIDGSSSCSTPSSSHAVDVTPDALWTCAALKAFLKNHGGYLSGKKAESLER